MILSGQTGTRKGVWPCLLPRTIASCSPISLAEPGAKTWWSRTAIGTCGAFRTRAKFCGNGADRPAIFRALPTWTGMAAMKCSWAMPWSITMAGCYSRPIRRDRIRTRAISVKPLDGQWRLLYGNGGLHCLDVHGADVWTYPMGECQHVVAGRFRNDSEMQFISIDRTPVATHRRDENAWAILYLFDLNGKVLWQQQQEKGAWAIAPLAVCWSGPESPQDILVYGHGPGRPAVIYRGDGTQMDTLPLGVDARSYGRGPPGGILCTRRGCVGRRARGGDLNRFARRLHLRQCAAPGYPDAHERDALSGDVVTCGVGVESRRLLGRHAVGRQIHFARAEMIVPGELQDDRSHGAHAQ